MNLLAPKVVGTALLTKPIANKKRFTQRLLELAALALSPPPDIQTLAIWALPG
jgi:hypothetical protein